MSASVIALTSLLLTAGEVLPFADDALTLDVPADRAATVRVMAREVRVAGAARLARRWRKAGFCPRARADGADLVLGCDTDRLHVAAGKETLVVYRLRGLPWAASDEPLPAAFYAPELSGLGGPCPGTTPAGRAECALKAGNLTVARRELEAALATGDRDYAALRLADLSLGEGRPLQAVEWLARAGRGGNWGRLAAVRECELAGSCLGRNLFETTGLPSPLTRDLQLRELRVLRFEQPGKAVARLYTLGLGGWPEALCAGDEPICRDVVYSGLSAAEPEDRIDALVLYASGPVSRPHPTRPWLAAAAAEATRSLGIPHYGAAVMAAATADVPSASLSRHLYEVTSLYLQARDTARAAAVRAYASDLFGRALDRDAKWKRLKVRGAPAAAPAGDPFSADQAALAVDLASAALTLSRARGTSRGDHR